MQWVKFWVITLISCLFLFVCFAEAEDNIVKLAWDGQADCDDDYWLHWGVESGFYTASVNVGRVKEARIELPEDVRYAVFNVSCGELGYLHPDDEQEWGVKAPTGMTVIEK